jgi:ABC-type hemin transport system ATPase subunit
MIHFQDLTVELEGQVILEGLSGTLAPGRFHVLVGPCPVWPPTGDG